MLSSLPIIVLGLFSGQLAIPSDYPGGTCVVAPSSVEPGIAWMWLQKGQNDKLNQQTVTV